MYHLRIPNDVCRTEKPLTLAYSVVGGSRNIIIDAVSSPLLTRPPVLYRSVGVITELWCYNYINETCVYENKDGSLSIVLLHRIPTITAAVIDSPADGPFENPI